MSKEIERKFLVEGDSWKKETAGVLYRQGYLNSEKERTVRVRTIADRGFLTVKGITIGCTRLEFEYEIPYADAEKMLDELAEKPIIEKLRYVIPAGDRLKWEIDEFLGVNQGLVVAEIELPSEETGFNKPEWLGQEGSYDPRFFNANLVAHPYRTWQNESKEKPL